MTRILVVGRHTPVLPPGYDVVKHVAIAWNNDLTILERQWNNVKAEARKLHAFVVLQNTPAVLLNAIIHDVRTAQGAQINVGVMVMSSTTPRYTQTTVKFKTVKRCWNCSQLNTFAMEANDVAEFCDPRSKREISTDKTALTITVDPKSGIQFDRIDWY